MYHIQQTRTILPWPSPHPHVPYAAHLYSHTMHSVDHLAVVVLLRCFTEGPATRTELQDLQQQQAPEGGEALLQQEAVAQQAEELVHALQAHPLQLLPDTVQRQHQAVHLRQSVTKDCQMHCQLLVDSSVNQPVYE